jgi:hypothetical protein
VVLWIGYLQWHFRTHGDTDRLDPPLLDDVDNIQMHETLRPMEDGAEPKESVEIKR